MRVAINGFGRIGRLALRAGWHNESIEFVHINDPSGSAHDMAHLLEFDSIHGRWSTPVGIADQGNVSNAEPGLIIDGQPIRYSRFVSPEQGDWSGVDLVLECSGKFRDYASLAPYREQGVDSVVVSAPLREADAVNIVMGVNESIYKPLEHHIVTAASCTTNCIAPVVKVLHEGIGIEHGSITTIHASTNTQTIIDSPHADMRRARAHSTSLIPTSTGSAKAITTIFPELQGRLDGVAVRVPLLSPSMSDCVFEMAKETTVDEINALFEKASQGALADILGYETRPLVSVDYRSDARSGIVDALSTMVTHGTQVKVLVWYDNEWGYAHRLVELASMVERERSVL